VKLWRRNLLSQTLTQYPQDWPDTELPCRSPGPALSARRGNGPCAPEQKKHTSAWMAAMGPAGLMDLEEVLRGL
jgi:hypothetical protein